MSDAEASAFAARRHSGKDLNREALLSGASIKAAMKDVHARLLEALQRVEIFHGMSECAPPLSPRVH